MSVICLLCSVYDLSFSHLWMRSSHMTPHIVQPSLSLPIFFRMLACLYGAVKPPSSRHVLVHGMEVAVEILRISKPCAGTRWDGTFKRQSVHSFMRVELIALRKCSVTETADKLWDIEPLWRRIFVVKSLDRSWSTFFVILISWKLDWVLFDFQ